MWSSSSIKLHCLCWPMASPTDVVCPKALSEHLPKQMDKNPEPCWKTRHCPMTWPSSNGKGHPSKGHWSPPGDDDICSERAGLNFTASGAHSRSWEKPWRSGFINVWIASASCPLHSNNSFCLFSFKIASIETPALSSIISFVLCFFWTCFPFERLIFKTSENLQTSNATWKTRHLEKWREKTFEFMSTWQWNKSHWILHQA